MGRKGTAEMETVCFEKINCEYDGKIIISGGPLSIDEGSITLVCGRTGSGKSTLLKYISEKLGDKAAYVVQDPDSQTVCSKVYEELSMAPCGCRMNEADIRRRVAETAGYFGISSLIDRDINSLSGGEKQLVNIAAAMTANPGVLILDEPVSMLDPIMSEKITDSILKLHRELGLTVIIAEQRPDELWSESDTIVLVHDGKTVQGDPARMIEFMSSDRELYELMPSYARMLPPEKTGQPVMTLSKARKKASEVKISACHTGFNHAKTDTKTDTFLEFRNVTFAYDKDGRKILNDMNLKVQKGQIAALLGENGSGKTTAAKIAAGLIKPYSGSVFVNGKRLKGKCDCASMLFQDVTCHFLSDRLSGRFDGMNPYDLSGGQRQLAALDLILSDNTQLLILDEPSKGLDRYERAELMKRVKGLSEKGVTVLIVTHDVDFAAETADVMALLFAGEVSAFDDAGEFVKKNIFYTTTAFRIWGPEKGIYTESDARKALR